MKRAAIVSPIRTPVGKFQGSLASMTAGELGAVIQRELVARTRIDPERIDDVIFAQGYGNGEAPCIARWSALAADFPIEIPGYQLDRRCGSGLQAVIAAAISIAAPGRWNDIAPSRGCRDRTDLAGQYRRRTAGVNRPRR